MEISRKAEYTFSIIEGGIMLGRLLAGFINFFVVVAEIFLILRVVLRLFGANMNVPFVQWIYDSSSVLLDPFRGIFPAKEIVPGSVLDFSALFAMLVYGLAGMAFLALVAYLTPSHGVAKKR